MSEKGRSILKTTKTTTSSTTTPGQTPGQAPPLVRRRSSGAFRRSSTFRSLKSLKSTSIILDIGDRYTKCGFAGENEPRFIFENNFKDPRNGKFLLDRTFWPLCGEWQPVKEQDNDMCSNELFSGGDDDMCTNALFAGGGSTVSVDPAPSAPAAPNQMLSVNQWKTVLRSFINDLYFRYLLVNPKHRKVIICENYFTPYKFKKALVETLFHVGVPGIKFLFAPVLPKFTTGIENGIFIDMGYNETRVVPVLGGYAIEEACTFAPLGMNTIVNEMKRRLLMNNKNMEDPNIPAKLDREAVENLVVRCCFVADKKNNSTTLPHVTHRLDNESTVFVGGEDRNGVFEVLFQNEDAEEEEEQEETSPIHELGFGIGHMVLDAISKCPIDARPFVIHNVLFVGGTSSIPGIQQRVLSEVNSLIDLPKYSKIKAVKNKLKYTTAPYPPNIIAWLGGSIVGSMELKNEDFLLNENYKEDEPLVPDWTINVEPELQNVADDQTF